MTALAAVIIFMFLVLFMVIASIWKLIFSSSFLTGTLFGAVVTWLYQRFSGGRRGR